MSLFDLQDVCIAIGSLATLDLPMVVDLIGIYGLKGPYCTLTTTNWFLQALSVIPRGSWRDVARRFTMIRWANQKLSAAPPLPKSPPPTTTVVAAAPRRNLFRPTFLVQADEGTLLPVVDLIRRNLPPSTVKCRFPRETGRSQAPRLQQVSRGNRHFTVDGGRLRQSGPRPDTRLLRRPTLEGTDSPRNIGRNKFRRSGGGVHRRLRRRGFWRRGEAALRARKSHSSKSSSLAQHMSSVSVRESRIQYLCDPQWFMDTASRGPTTIAAPESQFRTCPSDHDSIGYPRMSASGESSTTMHRLLHASGSHSIPPPNDPKTNRCNQDLGLIHSTNGNHLESPNEDSSIDHQVTIYLHAQNITMFPTNETWYFASQILVSSSGGLILILTAQSTRNMFRIHSDY
ncbi:hypothetical protein F511_39538 [Dorcoceras hygrometricum]|uniref:Acyl-CoA dehydrogenase-related protein n=1 Tax=Dorcoceras hygrometricum TaxID=472368 RepID=A0A2Z7ACS9_9LAMI|nr:hypothetical protein F511_39538 [Dorcoceras hygrometricum]